jgi:hypothetical protein
MRADMLLEFKWPWHYKRARLLLNEAAASTTRKFNLVVGARTVRWSLRIPKGFKLTTTVVDSETNISLEKVQQHCLGVLRFLGAPSTHTLISTTDRITIDRPYDTDQL